MYIIIDCFSSNNWVSRRIIKEYLLNVDTDCVYIKKVDNLELVQFVVLIAINTL